jgi:predicted ABC-type exoprotein transport system permease subunit
MNLEALIMLIVVIILVAVIFYISGALVSQDWSLGGSLVLRIIIVTLVAVFVIPLFANIGSADLGHLGVLLAFIILVVVVRFVLVEELAVSDEWLASIIISFIAAVLIFTVDAVSREFFDLRLLELL